MEIRGKIIAVLPVKDGIGKTSGNEWKSREFVLETEESKPQSVCLQLMNANIERYAVEVGMTVHGPDILRPQIFDMDQSPLSAAEPEMLDPGKLEILVLVIRHL